MSRWRLLGIWRNGRWLKAAEALREAAIESDEVGHDLREAAFEAWREGTVMPESVSRWIREIGEGAE